MTPRKSWSFMRTEVSRFSIFQISFLQHSSRVELKIEINRYDSKLADYRVSLVHRVNFHVFSLLPILILQISCSLVLIHAIKDLQTILSRKFSSSLIKTASFVVSSQIEILLMKDHWFRGLRMKFFNSFEHLG